MSFAAVAILAAATNLIIERGVAVVHTTRLDRAQFSPVPPLSPPHRSEAASPENATPSRSHNDAATAMASAHHLVAAVERQQRAIEARASIDSPAESGEAEAATHELEAAAKELQGGFGPATVATALGDKLSAYLNAGHDHVQSADARRAALEAYTSCLDAMDRRIGTSLARAWKIFGRVIARQSLMQLHADLEGLRRSCVALGALNHYDAAAVELLADAERALHETFERNQAGFTRTEGADWTRQMRDDIAQCASLRESMVSAERQSRDSANELAAAQEQIVAAVAALPRPRVEPVIRVSRPPAASSVATLTPLPVVASPIPDAVTTTIVSDEHERRTAIACITAAVLCVLLTISVLTVRSILVPVSRMLRATDKLASGDLDVQVPRGGIKELDTLAVAFNRMAAQLAEARDVTQDYHRHLEMQVEQRTRQLEHLAAHDPLTMLPNRRQFFVLLNQALEWASENERRVAVFFIDIDNFKNLNDSLGHAFGDRVLMSVAQRLEQAASSFGFAARLGGDEFTVVYQDAVSAQSAYEVGRKLVGAFQQSLTVDGRDVSVSVSVGASLYPDHELGAEELLSAADAALFRAKALGRRQLAIFTPELLLAATRKFTTEQGVRRALERGEFELVFQPEVSLESLEIGLVEALLRWRLPDGRQAAPDEFLAVTEESGLIVEIGHWVLRNAFETASKWHHGPWPDVRMAINVSSRQLLEPRFVEYIQDLLAEYRLPPQCIELELTESVLQTGRVTLESLRRLQRLDIAIALDDFGTGYSSLASLEQLPLSRIKLDRTLIANIHTNARSAAITAALINLCNGLDLDVTAEGVERTAQFSCLAGHRTIHLQGYLISRPVAAEEILRIKSKMPQIMHDLLLSIPALQSSADVEFDGLFRPHARSIPT
jgi:diguanylate cyclase (GGDEF)-like protein